MSYYIGDDFGPFAFEGAGPGRDPQQGLILIVNSEGHHVMHRRSPQSRRC